MSAALPSSSGPIRDPDTDDLLVSLCAASQETISNRRPLVRSTVHSVPKYSSSSLPHQPNPVGEAFEITSWKTVEFAYRKVTDIGIGKELPTLARGLFTVKIDKGKQREDSNTVGSVQNERGRILVRGYDKFFNIGEISWTKPASIERYSAPPYLLTFKENGCIIFISALSQTQLIVTSKHSLDSRQARDLQAQQSGSSNQAETAVEVDEIGGEDVSRSSSAIVSHAAKGQEWLKRHLSAVDKAEEDLAAELWRRGETAVAELCDDSFEEHVLAYSSEKSGLYLHGLNSNTVNFQTRPMDEVCEFAATWGLISTRYLTLGSLDEVNEFTDRVGTTGTWLGEPIEGFVVRTSMSREVPEEKIEGMMRPPYAAGQPWFYKVKFKEPYLMYRDWRELTKKMLADKKRWELDNANLASQATDTTPLELVSTVEALGLQAEGDNCREKSKKQRKREQKARQKEESRREAATRGTVPLPDMPQANVKRPETQLFIQWCHHRMYGSADGKVKASSDIFEGINLGKGIIRLRDMFLAYLETAEGRAKLAAMGKASGKAYAEGAASSRPFTHVLIVPIAIPGCGKTSLFLSLSYLYPDLMGHTQSDDVTSKKTTYGFLQNVCSELSKSKVVLADRNNHLLQHRDEIITVVRAWEERGGMTEEAWRARMKSEKQEGCGRRAVAHTTGKEGSSERGSSTATEENGSSSKTSACPTPRVKMVAMPWSLDMLPGNTLHRMMSDRILARGDNHQSLVADTESASGSRSHEATLWTFLKNLETLGSAQDKGEGKGMGDAHFDDIIKLEVETSQEEQLAHVCRELQRVSEAVVGEKIKTPTPEMIRDALAAAARYRVAFTKAAATTSTAMPRYYGIAVEGSVASVVAHLLKMPAANTCDSAIKGAQEMLALLQQAKRVISRPHITLVHSSALQPMGPEEEAQLDEGKKGERSRAKSQWERYSALSKLDYVDFEITLGHLAFDSRVMALSVSHIQPTEEASKHLTADDFWTLQGGKAAREEGDWRPHVTVGTTDESVPAYEASRVIREAADDQDQRCNVGVIQAGHLHITLKGRLMAMSYSERAGK